MHTPPHPGGYRHGLNNEELESYKERYHVPDLGAGITAPLAHRVAIRDLAVEAAIHGSHRAALQALPLDPVVPSYEAAVSFLIDLLTVHAPYLPLFQSVTQ